jgi:hypothetical protein
MSRFILSLTAVVVGLAITARAEAQVPNSATRKVTPLPIPGSAQPFPADPFGLWALQELQKLSAGGGGVAKPAGGGGVGKPGPVKRKGAPKPVPPKATPVPTPKQSPIATIPASEINKKKLQDAASLLAPQQQGPVAKIPASELNKKRLQDAASLLASPDLVVKKVQVRDKQAQVIVANEGTAAAGLNRLNLQALRDNQLVASEFVSVPALDAGKSITLTLSSNVALDIAATRIVVKVDDGNGIAESNEANNELVRTVLTPVQPDLIIRKVDVLFNGNEFRVEVVNVGKTEAKSFRVRQQFFKDGRDAGGGTLVVPALGSGQAKSLAFFASANPADRMVITVDDLNQIAEANESNNTFAKVLR